MRTARTLRAVSLAVTITACDDAPIGAAPGVEVDAATYAPPCTVAATFRFVPEIGDASEGYVCFGFDAAALTSMTVGGVLWQPPLGGALRLHHATLYAVPTDYPNGPVACDGMPAGSIGLHVWTPGNGDLVLPSDTGLELPAATKRFVVQAHTIRVGSGPVEDGRVAMCAGPSQPTHLAALMSANAPVPAIRPMHVETSDGTCTLAGDVHLWSVWPHMHLAGHEIEVDLSHDTGDAGDAGAATPLVDVVPWDFHAQRTYPLSVDALAGDRIHTRCTWQNTTDSYILPGPLTENEMCNAVLIAWPAEHVGCLPSP